MKKADLIKILVPKVIACWKDNSPQYKHDGKERQLTKQFQTWKKKDINNYLDQLIVKGY